MDTLPTPRYKNSVREKISSNLYITKSLSYVPEITLFHEYSGLTERTGGLKHVHTPSLDSPGDDRRPQLTRDIEIPR